MKVSFTHLVAWAIVNAAIEWRVMGRSYAESDGKSQAIEPGGVNLGIAVDVERKDGSRSLMVPCIKGADQLDFAGFHAYYEELINKTRAEQAQRRRLPGDDDHAHQSGRARHVGVCSPADGGPGNDRRHRLDRISGRVGPRPRREAQGPRRVEGDDDDVDLRPSGDPGGRIGLVPATDRSAAPGRGLLL